MRWSSKVRWIHLIVAAGLALNSPVFAGTMSLAWNPVAGATGYRVYYGTQSGSYDQWIDVGNTTQATLDGLDACARYYTAIKAYNPSGESPQFSAEVEGGIRPEIGEVTPARITQGEQVPFEIRGAQFESGAELNLDPDSVPTDIDGNPLIRLDSYSVTGCRSISGLITVEPTVRGLRAMQVGDVTLRLSVVNPDMVHGTSPTTIEIDLDQHRMDLNRSDSETRDRVDGQDLVWLSHAYGSREGDERFNADADINGDGLVDGADLAQLATGFGGCWSGGRWSEDACP